MSLPKNETLIFLLTGWILLIALWLGFHFPLLFGDQAWFFLDASRFFFPLWKWGWETWGMGVLPLWNPLFGAGRPFAADPQTVSFYPFMSIFALLKWDFWSTVHWLLAAHHLVGMAGMWVWLRSEGRSLTAAFSGALAFGFCTHTIGLFFIPVLVFVTSWGPWLFWSFDRVIEGKPYGKRLFLSFASLQLGAGYPILCYLNFFFLFFESVFRLTKSEKLKKIGWLLAIGMIALGLNALWVLPFFELLQKTNFFFREKMWSLSLEDLQTLWNPFWETHPLWVGVVDAENSVGKVFWTVTYYLGWPLAVGFLLSFSMRRGKKNEQTALLGWLLLTLLTLGENGFLLPVLKSFVPGFSAIYRSGLWLPLWILYAVRVCAYGIEVWFSLGFYRRLLFALPVLLLPFFSGGFRNWPQGFWWWCLCAAGMALAALFFQRKTSSAVGFASFLGAVVFSIFPAALSLRGIMPLETYRFLPDWAVQLHLKKGERFYHTEPVMSRLRMLRGTSWADAYEGGGRIFAPNRPLLFGWGSLADYNTLQFQNWEEWKHWSPAVSFEHSRMALDYMGARVVVGKTTLGLKEIARESEIVYENPNRLPRWFAVHRVEEPGVWGEFLTDDMKRVEKAGGYRNLALTHGPSRGIFPTPSVEFAQENPNRLKLVLSKGGPAFLASSDFAFPGWKVMRPEKGVLLQRVNHAFLGAEVSPGVSEITLSYQPASFRLGAFLSCVLLAGLSAWGVLFRFRKNSA